MATYSTKGMTSHISPHSLSFTQLTKTFGLKRPAVDLSLTVVSCSRISYQCVCVCVRVCGVYVHVCVLASLLIYIHSPCHGLN